MNDFLSKFKPIDLIAIILVCGGLTLVFFGIDGIVGAILTTIVVFYFGKKEIVDKIAEKNLPVGKTETVESRITKIAKEEGVDPSLAIRVAKCESGLNPGAINVNINGSVDRGLYQWNNKWHPEIDEKTAFHIEKSTRAFCKAFKAGHLDWWNATKTCWDI